MVYYTGDIHGDPGALVSFAEENGLAEKDILVILGDVGANYYGDQRDRRCKDDLARIKPSILCIHGNHERRPETISTYRQKEWNGGTVWYEERHPSLLFAKDGEIFDLEGTQHLVIGGAYSVDKYYRLERGYLWFSDEQPSEETKAYVEEQVSKHGFEIIISHTCPFKYEPIEAFLPAINQSMVDDSTERWLDEIEEKASYRAWLCGHWHIDKRVDKMRFLFHDVVTLEMIRRGFK